jgi:hypothetical protein
MENQKDTYKDILANLRTKKPTMDEPEAFSIGVIHRINQLPDQGNQKHPGPGNFGSWKLFIGLRNAMAVAAALLIGFFVYQQWEIMSKVSRLEQEIQNQKEASVTIDRLELTKSERIKQLLEQKLITNTSGLKKSLKNEETVILQKSALTYLLESLNELEKQNRQLKDQLIMQNSDTMKKNKNEKSKTL